MTGMAIKRDFRKLTLARQAELRRIAMAMVRAGKTRIEAAEAVGVNRRFVGRWVKAAAQSGEAVLAGRRQGRRPGEQKALSAAQEEGRRSMNRAGVSRSGRTVFYAVDAPCGAGADGVREWGLAGPAGDRPLSAGLGLHRAASDAPGH